MRFFKPKYLGTNRFESEWHEAITAYGRHLDSILPALPESVRAFAEYSRRYPLHDRVVERILSTRRGELAVHVTGLRLELIGVRSSRYPEVLHEPTYWLYEEVDVAPRGGFVLRVLADAGEIDAEAQDLRLFGTSENRYLIPEEPPPEPPSLFLDRRGQRHRKK